MHALSICIYGQNVYSMILCIDYVSNGIESNGCETVVFENYHFVHITAYYVYRQNLHKYIKLV